MSRPSFESPGFALEPFAWPTAPAFYRAWLRLGVVAVLLLPEARASHALLGWLPFWLLGVPALALLQWRIARRSAQRHPVDALPARHVRRRRRGPAADPWCSPARARDDSARAAMSGLRAQRSLLSVAQSGAASRSARSGARRSP